MFAFHFLNPWGFAALGAWAAIVAIHFLQRQSRHRRVSTLFLLDRLERTSRSGSQVEKLRRSAPFWLQMLAVALLALLLARPAFVREASVHRVVVVMDESASMQAFRDEATKALRGAGEKFRNAASRTDWTVLGSRAGDVLWKGVDMQRFAVEAMDGWRPRHGRHDAGDALRLARTLAGERGSVVFLTDHVVQLPVGVTCLSVGEEFGNTGFAGLSVDEKKWRAWVRNTGASEAERRVSIGNGTQQISLKAGGLVELSGTFADDADRVELRMDQDRFALDDAVMFVRPRVKPLKVAVAAVTEQEEFCKRLVGSLSGVLPSGAESADLVFATYDALAPSWPTKNAVVFVADAGASASPVAARAVVENRGLARETSWQGLLAGSSLRVRVTNDDEVLVWQNDVPIVFVRHSEAGTKQLVFNFEVSKSNVSSLPAAVIVLHRFAEEIRSGLRVFERRNFVSAEKLGLSGTGGLTFVSGTSSWASEPGEAVAPVDPGFFVVEQNGERLVEGASRFETRRNPTFVRRVRKPCLLQQ